MVDSEVQCDTICIILNKFMYVNRSDIMVFYFSGTGNSQLVAKQIAEITGDELISINQLLKEGGKDTFSSKRPLVFVAPTYAWRMPKVVEGWIRKTSFKGNCKAYFVLTCGGGCGNAAAYAKKLCEEKGMLFYGLASVLMPENYLAMFPTPDEPECRTIVEKAKTQVSTLAMQIQGERQFVETPISFVSRLLSGPVNIIYYPLFVHDKGFRVSTDCISCGKCAQRCPLRNIDIVNGKPVWKGKCTHCMACIGGCPTEAIDYKSKSAGRHRHYIMEE